MIKISSLVGKSAVMAAALCLCVFGQTGLSLLEGRFVAMDSSFAGMVNRPETRMKEIAPAESLYQAALADHPEILCIIRTNSKGLIVNAVSREDSTASRGADVTGSEWYDIAMKTSKPYHGPLLAGQGTKRYALFWSRPIRVKNNFGLMRFGGVVVAKINIAECFKRFADDYHEPFQILLDGKEFYYRTWAPNAPFEEKPVRIPGVTGLTCKEVKKNAPALSKAPDAAAAVDSSEISDSQRAVVAALAPVPPLQQAPLQDTPGEHKGIRAVETAAAKGLLLWKARWLGTAAIILVFICALALSHNRKKHKRRELEQRAALADRGALPITEEDMRTTAHVRIDADVRNNHWNEIERKVRLDLEAEIAQRIRKEEGVGIEEKVRGELVERITNDVNEKETNGIRNMVITELKTDIRRKLEKNEAEAIHAALQQEMTDAWKAEIKENYYSAIHQKELENLVKVVREKLIEKEMPLLVESHRTELSKEIREKIVKEFSDEIEQRQRNVLKAEIVKKLQSDEYPRLLEEEREKLRASLKQRIEDTEMGDMETRAREDLKDKIKTEALAETGAVRERLLYEITEEQRARIAREDLPNIIEAQRDKIAQEEAPALRLQLLKRLRAEELESMHARVKAELYEETVQGIRTGLEEKYATTLETSMAEYKDRLGPLVRSEIYGGIQEEYRNLISHLENLAESMRNVEALDSLSQTVTLLINEKKKYKYFNLNSAQTESLLEYLKRVQSRFNIFLDKIDESVREMELKINSVMNKLTEGA